MCTSPSLHPWRNQRWSHRASGMRMVHDACATSGGGGGGEHDPPAKLAYRQIDIIDVSSLDGHGAITSKFTTVSTHRARAPAPEPLQANREPSRIVMWPYYDIASNPWPAPASRDEPAIAIANSEQTNPSGRPATRPIAESPRPP
ncbi:hypothetical protein C8Q73DRAFT_515419 [Cubamyces lactineus]|nr:hypothetical protein C8Q73DRAFT_515419 [Cubamyces lactineus]